MLPEETAWNTLLWPESASTELIWPLVLSVDSSVTLPETGPLIAGMSLVPLMVMLTVLLAEPSTEVTTKVSMRVWPAPSPCTWALPLVRLKFHTPALLTV